MLREIISVKCLVKAMNKLTVKVPVWGRYFLILLLSALALFFLVLTLMFARLANPGEGVNFLSIFFLLSALITSLGVFRVLKDKMLSLIADGKGLYLPGPIGSIYREKLLFVPWSKVVDIRYDKAGVGKANAIHLDITIGELDRANYFPKNFPTTLERGPTKILIVNPFIDKPACFRKLIDLKYGGGSG